MANLAQPGLRYDKIVGILILNLFARSREAIITALLDFLAVFGSWYTLYTLLDIQGDVFLFVWGITPFTAGLFLSAYWVLVLWVMGLYKEIHLISRFDETVRVAKATAIGTLLLFFFITTRQQSVLLDAKLSTFVYWALTTGAISINRFIIRTLQRVMAQQGKGLHRAFIIGTGETARTVYEDLQRNRILGMQVEGFVQTRRDANATTSVDSSMIAGTLDEIRTLIREKEILDLIVALDPDSRDELMDVLGRVDIPEISVKILPDFYQLVHGFNKTNQIFGLPLIEISPEPMPFWEKIVKRMLDIIVSILVLTISIPLNLVIALLIKLNSSGPLIYRQKRVGKNGKLFTMYKFRTMYENAEAHSGPTWARENDPRVTGVGYWLRKLRLDEIPQFWNVLRGDMSLVGPRPERPYFVDQFKEQIPFYTRRLRVQPGITGWAQVKWKYDASLDDVAQKTKYDLFYVENMSLTMDMKILINTVSTIVRGKGH